MYNALKLSKYIIYYADKINKKLTNLQLQKILYYIQGNFLRRFDECAFPNNIEAWKFGPVVPEVYYKYYVNVGMPIKNVYSSEDLPKIEKAHKELIDRIVEEKLSTDAWELVKATHDEEPWKLTYENGRNRVISKELIKESF